MLQVEHVTKQFASLIAVNDVSFAIPQGEVVGLLGPNGAGKTTLFRLIAGFLHPDAGRIRCVASAWPKMALKPEGLLYPGRLRVAEYLEIVAHLSNLDRTRIRPVVADALERVGLTRVADKRIRDSSKGMRQRLGLAQMLIGQPALLLIDEPTDGLDPEGQADIRCLIQELHAKGCTIVLSSHQLYEVKQVCTRLAILNQGRLQYESSMADALTMRPHVIIQATRDLGAVRPRLEALHPRIQVEGMQVVLTEEMIGLRPAVLRVILDAGLDVCHVEQQRVTLEEIYARVTQ